MNSLTNCWPLSCADFVHGFASVLWHIDCCYVFYLKSADLFSTPFVLPNVEMCGGECNFTIPLRAFDDARKAKKPRIQQTKGYLRRSADRRLPHRPGSSVRLIANGLGYLYKDRFLSLLGAYANPDLGAECRAIVPIDPVYS